MVLASAALAGEICMVPSAANNRSITVACGGLGYWNDHKGFRTDATATCDDALCFGGTFGWTISSSPADPLVNSGPLAPGASLYLWLYCNGTPSSGMAAAEFDLAAVDLSIVGFTAMNGFQNFGTDVALLLLSPPGCPSGSVVAGRIDVETPVGVDPLGWGRIKSFYR
jgi:hypothetical protein